MSTMKTLMIIIVASAVLFAIGKCIWHLIYLSVDRLLDWMGKGR